MRSPILFAALIAAGCGHTKEAEVTQAVEPSRTIAVTFTADTARLLPASSGDAAGEQALLGLIRDDFAAVGQVRPAAASAHVVVVDLPAPGWALRATVSPRPEMMCLLTLEPITTGPDEHPVEAAPWSVQSALAEVNRRLTSLSPPPPPMAPARFSALRQEAAAAAAAGRDPSLTPDEYVRVPRPITGQGQAAPYYTPPESQDLKQ